MENWPLIDLILALCLGLLMVFSAKKLIEISLPSNASWFIKRLYFYSAIVGGTGISLICIFELLMRI